MAELRPFSVLRYSSSVDFPVSYVFRTTTSSPRDRDQRHARDPYNVAWLARGRQGRIVRTDRGNLGSVAGRWWSRAGRASIHILLPSRLRCAGREQVPARRGDRCPPAGGVRRGRGRRLLGVLRYARLIPQRAEDCLELSALRGSTCRPSTRSSGKREAPSRSWIAWISTTPTPGSLDAGNRHRPGGSKMPTT
jgi:hypothetical protein